MPGLLQEPQNNDQMEQTKSLFQAGYQMLYDGGGFDALREQAEQNPVGAVTQFLSTIATQILKDDPNTDVTVVVSALIGLLGEIVDALNETGVIIEPEKLETIIGSTIQQTLGNVPELGDATLKNPQVQEALQNDPRVQEELAQRQPEQQPPQQQQAPQQPQGLLGGPQ